MKPADSLPEHRSPAKDAPPEPGPRKSEDKEPRDFEPKYLDVPWQKRRSSGGRNLIVGILLLIVSIAVLGQAFLSSGSRVLMPVAAALLAVVTLFILARARVLRQRNGGFLGLAVVCLLAALIPFLENVFNGSLLSTTAKAEPIPAEKKSADVPTGQPAAQLPQLTQVYQISPPSENVPRFKVVRDLRVEMDGKTYLIKTGEVFPVSESTNDEVRFNVGDQQIALRKNLVEMIGSNNGAPAVAATPINQGQPSAQDSAKTSEPAAASKPSSTLAEPDSSQPETPAQTTEWAQKEAIRRYPALGQKNSPENRLYIETYQELKHTGASDFFADPYWPLQLAELLARRQKWNRPGQPAADPAVAPEEPPAALEELKPEEPNQDASMQDKPKPEQAADQPAPEQPQGGAEDLPSKQ